MGCYDKILQSLDARQLAATSSLAADCGNHRIASLNIAAWVSVADASEMPVTLSVSYRDGGQYHEVAVDRGCAGFNRDVLLSGVAHLPIRRKLEQVELRLRSQETPCRIQIQDIFVQPLH